MFIDFIRNIQINDGFWSKKLEHIMDETLPYQWKALNDMLPDTVKSGAIANFKMIAGEIEKGEYSGFVFQDSDLYKWLEAVAYSLMVRPDAKLEKTADEIIELISKTQWDDGYINSHFTLKCPEKRWTNIRDAHELYCAGHMFEAAAAYFVATGKKRFIDISEKFADHIINVIGLENDKLRAYPGHEEIELALVKLFKVTGNKKYFKLAEYFINERGKKPYFFDEEAIKRGDIINQNNNGDIPYKYHQAHMPVREQTAAAGHAVRALYLYSGITDVAALSGDESLKQTVRALWKNVTETQMYITGGVGSQNHGEAFSFDYDLPNDEAYSETCAQIGLFLWAHRMFEMDRESKYANIMERVLYNGIISGVSLDGKKYFYTNPLEIIPYIAKNRNDKTKDTERQGWFPCACCPPNLARMMLSLGSFVYSVFDNEIYINLYIGSVAKFNFNDNTVKITQKSSYEKDGRVSFIIETQKAINLSLKLRIPYWADETPAVKAEGFEIKATDNGYVQVTGIWSGKSRVDMEVLVRPKIISANDKVAENAGRVAITRGALVYCIEEADNGSNLSALSLLPETDFKEIYEGDLLEGIVTVSCKGLRRKSSESLYEEYNKNEEETIIKAVPYYAWNNRGVGEMRVWIRLD